MKLFQKELISLWIIIGYFTPFLLVAQSTPIFQEKEGLVVIEVESANNYGNWELETTKSGYTGAGYLHYKGANYFNNPGNSPLNFKVAIEKTGKYRFQWHSLIAVGDSNTEHNDSWLRCQDASDFYGEKGSERVYPKGVGKTPNPEGSSKDGWMKIYQNTRNNWTFQTRTSDNDPHEIFVEFDSVGVYTLEIAGRSNGHAIDRLILYHSEVGSAFAQSVVRPESERVQTVSIKEIRYENLTIRPTLADTFIYFDLPSSIRTDVMDGQIINSMGQKIQTFSVNVQTYKEVTIPIHQLGQGIHFIQFQIGGVDYKGKFVKN